MVLELKVERSKSLKESSLKNHGRSKGSRSTNHLERSQRLKGSSYNACIVLRSNNNSFVGRSRPVVLFILYKKEG